MDRDYVAMLIMTVAVSIIIIGGILLLFAIPVFMDSLKVPSF